MEITLETLYAKLTELEAKVDALGQKPPAPLPEPQPITIDVWTRPADNPPTKYLGVQMTVADVSELIDRARYSINWRGMTCLVGEVLDKAWALVEALKVAQDHDPIVDRFRTLVPDTAYLLILTGRIPVVPTPFGAGDAWRVEFAGITPQQFIETQLQIVRGGGSASGDE